MLQTALLKQECNQSRPEDLKVLLGQRWQPWTEMSAIGLRWMAPDGKHFKWEFIPISGRRGGPAREQEETHNAETELWQSNGPAEDIVMDEKIWSTLPEDILAKVLTWLPLSSISRFRSVCSKWKCLFLSDSFLNCHSKLSARRPWFLLCTVGKLACTFDPAVNKWLTIAKPSSPGTSVIASAGSLLCLGNQVAECRVLLLCNPITRSLRNLPQMQRVKLIHKVSMMMGERSSTTTSTFTIVVAGEDGTPTVNPYTYNLLTEVYDSSTNCWEMAGNPLPEAKFGSDPGVWCKGVFYCITELPYGVVMFELKGKKWSELKVGMPKGVAIPSLMNVRGRLMMVGRVKGGDETRGIWIWELNVERREWVEVKAMPERVCEEFLAPLGSYSPFVCAGVGHSIFLTTYLSPHVIIYDLVRDSWSWLPRDPLFPRNRDFHLLGFAFEPRFGATL